MTLSETSVSFRIGDLLKTSRPGHHVSQIIFEAYAPDSCLCVHTVVVSYLDRTSASR